MQGLVWKDIPLLNSDSNFGLAVVNQARQGLANASHSLGALGAREQARHMESQARRNQAQGLVNAVLPDSDVVPNNAVVPNTNVVSNPTNTYGAEQGLVQNNLTLPTKTYTPDYLQNGVMQARNGNTASILPTKNALHLTMPSNASSFVFNKDTKYTLPQGSKPYQTFITEASKAYNVPEPLIAAVMQTESGFRPNAVSHTGVKGLMQVTQDTYNGLGFTGDRADPRNSIFAGTKLLGNLYKQYGNWEDALYAYNGGGYAVKGMRENNWGSISPNKQKEVRRYASAVGKFLNSYTNNGGI